MTASRISKLSADFALLPPEQFVPQFYRAINEQKAALIAMGLHHDDAQICAQSIVAAAVNQAKRLEAGAGDIASFNLEAAGFASH